MGADEAGVNEKVLLLSEDAALSGGLKTTAVLGVSAAALGGSQSRSATAGFAAFLNVNDAAVPALPFGLKVKGALGLGVSLRSAAGPTLSSENGPRVSS